MTSKNNGSNSTSTSTTSTTSGGASVLTQPKRLKVGETEAGLITIEIQLRKFKLKVIEANGFSRFKLSSFATELLKELDDSDDYENIVRKNMITEVWAPLKVCSEGEVPDRDQFLSLPKVDLAFWVETAKELGHEFRWLDGLNRVYDKQLELYESSPQADKKKEKSLKQSTKGS